MVRLLVLFTLLGLFGNCFTDSCKDIYLTRRSVNDGIYYFNSSHADPYLIYCHFERGHGYTFITTTAHQYTFLGDHHYERTEFKVILLHSNGSQSETVISKPEKSRDLDILYTYKASSNIWLTNDLMYPYITVSMKTKKKNMTTRGYLVNGTQVSNPVCDKKSNKKYARLIFGFLFNHNNIDPSQNEKRRKSTDYLHKWTESTSPLADEKRLPGNFFSFFEVKHKNCGGYMTSDDFDDVIGAAIGLKYVIRCGKPQDVLHTTKNISGYEYKSKVTYTCNQGYEFDVKQTTLTCSSKGLWYGAIAKCILIKPRTCFDHVTMYNSSVSGIYIVYNMKNEPYSIYCDFYDNYTLTFFTLDSIKQDNLDIHFNDETVVIVRSSLTNGEQVDSEIRQLKPWENDTFNFKSSYSGYYGDELEIGIHIKGLNDEYSNIDPGYNVNGIDVHYSNERGYRPDSFSFRCTIKFTNPETYRYTQAMKPIEQKWLSEAIKIPAVRYMPRSHFFKFKMHTPVRTIDQNSFNQLYGLNFGLRFNHN